MKNFFDRINMAGYKSGLSHKVFHVSVALLIAITVGLVFFFLPGSIALGVGAGAGFYWGWEFRQAQDAKARIEIWDAIYPTIAVFTFYLILFVYHLI
jgi:hypothetical protein